MTFPPPALPLPLLLPMRCFGATLTLCLVLGVTSLQGQVADHEDKIQFRSPPLPSQVHLLLTPEKRSALKAFPPAQILRITARNPSEASVHDPHLPGLAGEYEWERDRLIFFPLFPFQSGVLYEAVARLFPDNPSGPQILQTFEIPKPLVTTATQTLGIFPSTSQIPENLLKFYLEFSAPMQSGRIYQYIHLLDQDGMEIELPFLEIDEELWNPNQTRLTLFIDPGRIKREVRPLEEIGPSLQAGKAYCLKIDAEWKDAQGLPLKESFQKNFTVVEPDRAPIEPGAWQLTLPKVTSRHPLTLDFGKPLDYALSQRLIQVRHGSEKTVKGVVTLAKEEREWSFTPDTAWEKGDYTLSIPNILEDLAGNNIGKPFEVDLFGTIQRRIQDPTTEIPFTLQP